MNDRDLFLIGDIPGFTPQIGRLVSKGADSLVAQTCNGEDMSTSPPNNGMHPTRIQRTFYPQRPRRAGDAGHWA